MTRYRFDASWKLAMRATILLGKGQWQLQLANHSHNVPSRSLRRNKEVSLSSEVTLLARPQHPRLPNHFHRVDPPGGGVLTRVSFLSDEPDYAEASFAQSLDRLVIITARRGCVFAFVQGFGRPSLHDPGLSQMVRLLLVELTSELVFFNSRNRLAHMPKFTF